MAFHCFRQALAQWAVFQRLSLRTFGRPQTLPGRVRLPLAAGFGTMGCFLPAFNPDVWPPSNASRRGTVATGSARGFKTWLFTVSGRLWHNGLRFNGFHSGRLAALKPSPAGYGRHWLQALVQWAVFLPAFNPDVWPPSNPSRRGTVATGSARGFKTWLFTVSGRLWHNGLRFNGFHSGRLAALKPFPAGYGCHWLC